MHPDNTFFFFSTSVPRCHSCVFPAQQCGLWGSDCRLWGGWFSAILTRTNRSDNAAPSRGESLPRPRAKRQSRNTSRQPLSAPPPPEPAPNTTTTQLMGPGRSQRRPGPALVFTANTNRARLEYRVLPSLSADVCSAVKRKKKWFGEAEHHADTKKKRSDRGCLSPPRQPYSH